MSEHSEQAAYFEWVAWNRGQYPELRLAYAVPNGGHRHKATALRLQAEGVRAGVPDIHLPVARGPYIGLWLEMKFGRNKTSDAQDEWIAALRAAGHMVSVCYGCDAAIQATLRYLEFPPRRRSG